MHRNSGRQLLPCQAAWPTQPACHPTPRLWWHAKLASAEPKRDCGPGGCRNVTGTCKKDVLTATTSTTIVKTATSPGYTTITGFTAASLMNVSSGAH
jgi:hypothetical protein